MLKFEEVGFVYPNGHIALKPINFALKRGLSLGILGESGSGKSTVAKLACRLLIPTNGSILRKGTAQMIFQNPTGSLNPCWSIRRILEEPLKMHNIKKSPKQLLQEVGLSPEMLERTPLQISGGQCQRVAIARALSLSPDFLIIDEGTSSLDSYTELQILSLLKRRQAEEGFGMVVISHHPEVIRETTNQLIVLRNGQVVESGETERIFNSPNDDYTKLLLSSVYPKTNLFG